MGVPGVPPHFFPTKTMTISGKGLRVPGHCNHYMCIQDPINFIYDIGSEATTGFPVLAVLILGSQILLNVVTLDLS